MAAGRRTPRLTPLYAHVGQQVRWRRKTLGFSLAQLAEQIGVTYQQLQKYEQGRNRLDIGMLYQLSRALDQPVASFFESYAAGDPAATPAQRGEPAVEPDERAARLVAAWRTVPQDVAGKVFNLLCAVAAMADARRMGPPGVAEAGMPFLADDQAYADAVPAVTAYLLLTVEDLACDRVVQELAALPEVRRCDSLVGDNDMIVLVGAPDLGGIDRIRREVEAIGGVARVSTQVVLANRFDRDRDDDGLPD